MVVFTGMFFKDKELEKLFALEPIVLAKRPMSFHSTFGFKPSDEELIKLNEIVGTEAEVQVVGFGHNDDNAGYRIILPDEYMKYYSNYDDVGSLVVPHITMSCSLTGNPVNTRQLKFEELPEPLLVRGQFGYYKRKEIEPSFKRI